VGSKAKTSKEEPFFGKDLFRFLEDLKAHNDREWFQENKARYEAAARDPMLRFIAAFSSSLAGISRHFVADPRPAGGSMFRIHRDTRFSKDKSPYKTHLAAHFSYRTPGAGGVHGPGFYLHIEPGASFAGGGLWHPDPESLFKVREAISTRSRAWKVIRESGLEIQGDALKRVPQGFDPMHPWAEDLKLKDFYTVTDLPDAQVLAADFPERVSHACRQASPLVAFLCKALDLPW
jgi:uncharacterized protein (TIGR02453 family)